jgi:hypothetical protein
MSESAQVKLSETQLEFLGARLGEKLTQTITVSSSVPGSLLEGNWEVAPHSSDPPQTPFSHAWIAFSPDKFLSNVIECEITIDTSRLMADRTYLRKILLHTNATPKTYSVTLKVQTTPFVSSASQLPYASIVLLLSTSMTLANMLAFPDSFTGTMALGWVLFLAVGTTAAVAVTETGALALALTLALVVILSLALSISLTQALAQAKYWSFGWAIIGAIVLASAGGWNIVRESVKRGFSNSFALALSILTILFGGSLGVWVKVGLESLFATSMVLGTGLILITMVIYPPLKKIREISKYLASEEYLIKP